MRVGDDAAAAAEGDDRCVDHLGEFEDFLAGMDRARADEDHRPLARCDQRGRFLDAVRIGLRRGEGIEHLRGTDVGALGEHVPRHFQRDRAAPARHHLLERARHHGGRDIGIFDAVGPFHEGAQGRELVRHLVQMAAALAEKLRRHLAGEAQHRLVAAERGQQPRARVQTPGPGTTLNTPGLPDERA